MCHTPETGQPAALWRPLGSSSYQPWTAQSVVGDGGCFFNPVAHRRAHGLEAHRRVPSNPLLLILFEFYKADIFRLPSRLDSLRRWFWGAPSRGLPTNVHIDALYFYVPITQCLR